MKTESTAFISSSALADAYFRTNCYGQGLGPTASEKCYALLLDSSNAPLGYVCIAQGNCEKCDPDVKLLCRSAIDAGARSVILAHNHPGGDVAPSKADIATTSRIRSALALFGITLLDHLVLGRGRYFSFSEEVTVDVKDDAAIALEARTQEFLRAARALQDAAFRYVGESDGEAQAKERGAQVLGTLKALKASIKACNAMEEKCNRKS